MSVDINDEYRFLLAYVFFRNSMAAIVFLVQIYWIWMNTEITKHKQQMENVRKGLFRETRHTGRTLLSFITWIISTLTFSKLIVFADLSNKLLTSNLEASGDRSALQQDILFSSISLFKSLAIFFLFCFFSTWRTRLKWAVPMLLLLGLFFAQPVCASLSFYYTQKFFILENMLPITRAEQIGLSAAIVSVFGMAMLLIVAPTVVRGGAAKLSDEPVQQKRAPSPLPPLQEVFM